MRFRFFNTFEPVAPVYRDLLPELARLGHDSEIILASSKYRDGEKRRSAAGIRVREIPSVARQGSMPGLRRALIHGSYVAGAALLSTFGRAPDLNVFMTQPPLFAAWGAALRRFGQQPYAVVTMDLYPWLAVQAGVLDPRAAPTRLAEKLATTSLTQAARVLAIGRCQRQFLMGMGVAPSRIRLVPNWVDESVVMPIDPMANELRRKHGLTNKFVVLYSGNMGVGHYFDDILQVAKRLASVQDIAFVFVGDGARRREIDAAIEVGRCENIKLLPYQPYELLHQSLGMGDVHLVSLREGFEGLMVPSKVYGSLAAGRPTIYQGSASGEAALMLSEHSVGTVVPIGDPDALEVAILDMYRSPDRRTTMGLRARELATTIFSRESGIARYIAALTEDDDRGA